MKTLTNKTTDIKNVDESFTTYSDLAKLCVNVIPEGGLDVAQMGSRLKVNELLEKANGTIKLEDTDAETLKACVSSMKWAMIHKDLVSFINDVKSL